MSNTWNEMERAKEDQYFLEKDKKIVDKRHHDIELEEFLTRFGNRCPKCGERLEEEMFCDVTIDKCPSCRGIWLDEGELDILKKSENPRCWLDMLLGVK